MKKIYNVTFARYGFVQVEAESENDAFAKVEGYGKEDICTDLFVDIAALALFSDRDYCDLLIYRGESVG